MSEGLPRGWAGTTLGEICSKPQYGWTCKAAKVGQIKYLRTTDISDGRMDWQNVPYCEESPDNVENYRVHPDDILVARAGSVGVSHRVQDVNCDAVFASYLIRFKALGGIAPKYIEFFLKSDEYWQAISEFTAGIAVPNVNATKLASLKLPLAPLNEQRRIVAKLEKLLDKVDACQQRLLKIPIILKRFRQSVLAAACSGRLTADWREANPNSLLSSQLPEANRDLPSSWIWKRIRDLAESAKGSIQSGPFGSNLLHSEFQPTGILAIGIDNVLDGKFNLGRQHRIAPQKYEVLKKYTACPLDVLVTVMATVGRCCVVPADIETAIITKHLYRITTNQRFVNPYYLMQCIRGCPFVLSQVETEIQGATRPGINGSILKEINVPLPPLPEQNEIVRRVDGLFALADQIEARYAKAKTRVDQISQSLLAKAFRGKLVPQDPKDEPASVLLERIKTERAKREMEIKAYKAGKRKATKGRMKKRY